MFQPLLTDGLESALKWQLSFLLLSETVPLSGLTCKRITNFGMPSEKSSDREFVISNCPETGHQFKPKEKLGSSIRYSIHFSRSNYFTGGLKSFHILMIWLIPFIWIILLKTLFKPTPGSYQFNNKKEPDSLKEGGLGIWIDSSTGE
jgi:hypothetical protein